MTPPRPGIRSPRAPAPRPRARVRAVAAALACATVAACDGGVAPIVPVATTISVADADVALSWLGATEQVAVTVRDQDGSPIAGAATSWLSEDAAVASVSEAGVITAVGNGATTVRVGSGAASATVGVEVRQLAVSMALAPDTALLDALGDTTRFVVDLVDFGGSPLVAPAVAWLVLDDAVATVAGGLVTAVSNGTTVVAATSSGFVATAAVRVAQTPATIGVSADSVTLVSLGDTIRLVASVSDPGGATFDAAPVTWETSDDAVALVSPDGLVTAVDNGVASVTATAGAVEVVTAVRVEQAVAALTLAPDSVVLADPGDTAALTATAVDALGAPVAAAAVAWSSADEAVATVDGTGVVRAVATGRVAITATSSGHGAMATARVLPELTLAASGPSDFDAEVTSSLSLSVRVEDLLGAPYAGAAVSWRVDGGGGAITSAAETTSDATGHTGAVWALGTAAGAQSASASIVTRGSTVVVGFTALARAAPASRAYLVADSALLSARGETVYLLPSFEDPYGNAAQAAAVAWASTDETVAVVAADGLVTGQDAGSAYVRGTLGATSDSILVTVVQRGGITITYDDGWLTTYTDVWPVMQELGFAGNVAVYTEAVGFPAYMSEAQLQELHDDGWSLVSHTVTHDSLTTLSDPVLDWELRTSRQWLLDRGFGRAAGILVAPYHDFGPRERTAAALYYQAARGASANGVVPDSLVFWQPSNPYELTGIDVEQLPYTTVAGRDRLRAMLERTRAEGRFLDVVFHEVPTANVPDLRAVLTILDDFRERVLPYHRLYPELARVVQ